MNNIVSTCAVMCKDLQWLLRIVVWSMQQVAAIYPSGLGRDSKLEEEVIWWRTV